jgi:hypothetical protein
MEPRISRHYAAGRRLGSEVPTLGGWSPWWGTWTVFQYIVALALFGLLLASYYLMWGNTVNRTVPFPASFVVIGVILLVIPFLGGWSTGFIEFDGRGALHGTIATVRYMLNSKHGVGQYGKITIEPTVVMQPWAHTHPDKVEI